jgi:hypothetical protein
MLYPLSYEGNTRFLASCDETRENRITTSAHITSEYPLVRCDHAWAVYALVARLTINHLTQQISVAAMTGYLFNEVQVDAAKIDVLVSPRRPAATEII